MTAEHVSIPPPIAARLAEITVRLAADPAATLGFPAASDIDWSPLAGIFTSGLVNHLGDPDVDGLYPRHVKDIEREAVTTVADLLRAPAEDRWGYVTCGASEGTLYGLWMARRLHLNAIVYHSTAAHPSVTKAIDLLGLRSIVLGADAYGELDYTDLAKQVRRHRDRPTIVVANIGTTFSEAIDDIRHIRRLLDRIPVPAQRRFLLADAALSGIPLATVDPGDRPGFDLTDGADAVVVSGHKFLGTPMPSAVIMTRASLVARVPTVVYTGSPDTTITSSRNGHAAVALWYALSLLGRHGLTERASTSREMAAYLYARLEAIGWPADRCPHAMTVTFTAPPEPIRARWRLANHHGRSHIVCVPGVTRDHLDTFVDSLTGPNRATDAPVIAAGNGRRRLVPRQLRRPATIMKGPTA